MANSYTDEMKPLVEPSAPAYNSVENANEGSTRAAVAASAMTIDRNQIDEGHARGGFSMEDSPSYEILLSHNLLTSNYRISTGTELELIKGNSTRLNNFLTSIFCCPLLCFGFVKNCEVENGRLKHGYDGRGNYLFFGPGVHQIWEPWTNIATSSVSITTETIVNGDRSIVTVPQGCVGYCTDRGQPVLLPPGMHQWQSPTLKFQTLIDLNKPVIPLGPWTLLTIDQGYMAVTQDNGRQIILNGGSVYLLTHRNWKFEKFVSTKIQTDQLERNEASSADNVIMLVDATVLWRIADVETAVRMSAETMSPDGSKRMTGDVAKLRNDVLKQAEASLASFIGTLNFSDTMAAAAVSQRVRDSVASLKDAVPMVTAEQFVEDEQNLDPSTMQTVDVDAFNMYNNDKLRDAVAHANEITKTYGVLIISINIISAVPKDPALQASLAKGAVAAAEAQMMETSAQGKSRAVQIEASAKAKQTMILAKADADAEIVRAEGSKRAADLLSANPVSVELAKIDRTGQAIAGQGNNSAFFFGANTHEMSALLSNPRVVNKPN